MGHVVTLLFGPTGSWKTVTSLTSRGKTAAIDRDNQMGIYVDNPALADVGAVSPVEVWSPTNSAETTREAVAEFASRVGLGPGDTLVDDPFSRLWELSQDAADVKFGQKGARTDYYALKQPVVRLMTYYRYAPFDIVLTAHQKNVWSKTENKPTDEVTFTGEPTKTPTDIHFIWRMEMGPTGQMEMVCVKEKGFRFKMGQRVPWQPLKRLYEDSGVYAILDRVKQGEEPDLDKQVEEAAVAIFGQAEVAQGYLAELLAGIATAKQAGPEALAAYRNLPANRIKFASLTAADQAKVRKAVE